MYRSNAPLCGAVARYLKVNEPLFTVVAGQSARAMSSPLNSALPALHSCPSGTLDRLCPAASPSRTPFQS